MHKTMKTFFTPVNMIMRYQLRLLAGWLLLAAGCQRADTDDARPLVVVTTSIIADVVAQVGGDAIRVYGLIPPGTDPHDTVFRPADLARVSKADLLIVNGLGLEGNIRRLEQVLPATGQLVSLDRGLRLRYFAEDDQHIHHHDHDHDHDETCTVVSAGGVDPHYWTDPRNVMVWVETIETALAKMAPDLADEFDANAKAYQEKLTRLDEWVVAQIDRIPPERRVLVTDHLSLGYFADRFGFEQVGVIVPSFDSLAQPAARDMVALMNRIRQRGVPAIFVSASTNPHVARQMAADAGIALVPVPMESLTDSDGPAPDYLAYMRHLVHSLVEQLGSNPQ